MNERRTKLADLRVNLEKARPPPFDINDIFTLGTEEIGKKLLKDDIATAEG